MTEDRVLNSEFGIRNAERKKEDGRWRTDDRRQMTEGRRQSFEFGIRNLSIADLGFGISDLDKKKS
jgi:hypothetical protein